MSFYQNVLTNYALMSLPLRICCKIDLIVLEERKIDPKTFSAASITPPTKDVITLENHVISCVLGDIPEQITGVTWDPATETSGEYNLLDGSESSNSQTSTLTITAAKLQSLDKLSSGVHTFTCSFTVGTTNVAVSATQTITIFAPSNKPQMRKFSFVCFSH